MRKAATEAFSAGPSTQTKLWGRRDRETWNLEVISGLETEKEPFEELASYVEGCPEQRSSLCSVQARPHTHAGSYPLSALKLPVAT